MGDLAKMATQPTDGGIHPVQVAPIPAMASKRLAVAIRIGAGQLRNGLTFQSFLVVLATKTRQA
jgi:hypothetical protein